MSKQMRMTYLGKDKDHRDCFVVDNGCILADVSRLMLETNGSTRDLWIKEDTNKPWYDAGLICPVDPNIEFLDQPKSFMLGMDNMVEYGVDEKHRPFVYRRDNFIIEYFDTLDEATKRAEAVYKEISAKKAAERKSFNHQIAMD